MKFTGNELLNTITDYIRTIRAALPFNSIVDADLCEDGTPFYFNSKNGTSYDWRTNNHSCEIFLFYKSTERGFLKIYVSKSGKIYGWGYLDEGAGEPVPLEALTIGKQKAFAIYKLFKKIADNTDNLDCSFNELDFDCEIEVEDTDTVSNICKLREKRGLRQSDLAKLMKVSQSVISNYETCETNNLANITVSLASKFASALNCEIETLYDFKEF